MPAVPYQPIAQRGPGSWDEPKDSADAGDEGPNEEWVYWSMNIRAAFAAEKRWREEGRSAEEMIWGPDGNMIDRTKWEGKADVSLAYSNIQTLKPLIYTQPPQPIVRRRFGGDGREDPVSTMAAEVAQRLIQYHIDTTDFDNCMETARDAWLIPGRGNCRVLYDAQIEETTEAIADPGDRADRRGAG